MNCVKNQTKIAAYNLFIILFISIISFGLVARTGYLGGKIRHTEIANGASVPSENSATEDDNLNGCLVRTQKHTSYNYSYPQ